MSTARPTPSTWQRRHPGRHRLGDRRGRVQRAPSRGCGRVRQPSGGLQPLRARRKPGPATPSMSLTSSTSSTAGRSRSSTAPGATPGSTSGCGRRPPAVPTGIGTGFVAVNDALRTVFADDAADDTVSAINTRTCDGTVTSSCATRPPNLRATSLQGPGYNSFPGRLRAPPEGGTAYVVNVGGRNIVSVTTINHCNATSAAGCRDEAPTVPEGEPYVSRPGHQYHLRRQPQPASDRRDQRRYLPHPGSGRLRPAAEIPVPDPGANISAIDAATHTLYAADPPSNNVFVVTPPPATPSTPPAAPRPRRPSRWAPPSKCRPSTPPPGPSTCPTVPTPTRSRS